MHEDVWWGNLKGINHVEHMCVCEDNITMDLKRKRLDAVNRCAYFKIVTGRRLL